MRSDPDLGELLSSLIGHWSGTGSGSYPTLEPFEFREETTFTSRPDHPAIHYEQRTWRLDGGNEAPSHWETGLIRFHSDGTVRWLDAQGGRVEVAAGSFGRSRSGWSIEIEATDFAGDDRVTASKRQFELSSRRLGYTMEMSTSRVPEMTLHLSATLDRAESVRG